MALSKLEQLIDLYSKVAAVIEVRGLKDRYGVYGTFKTRHGKPYLIIEKDQPETDKQVILTEEFMHFLNSVGVILDKDNLMERKQELQARHLTYKSIISMADLLRCYEMGLQSSYEIANELDLPEGFLKNAIEYFKTQLGEYSHYKGYDVVISDTINFYKSGSAKTM